jgi:hypothetical protein
MGIVIDLLKSFFYILGRPLFKCVQLSYEDNLLIELFKIAQIKLIPKKGDTSKIKNWRPISLLSNFYKILSRAINNRLKTVVGRVLSRAQKGFTQTRQIQEVVINLSETINNCAIKNIRGAMVCVDQAKAFDSVNHSFIEKSLKFFGFGERFISWIKTIGTNRKACVLFENGIKGEIFDLLKGTAQGDCPSPIIYNICAQILLFKIELCPEICRIDAAGTADMPVPLPVPALHLPFLNDANQVNLVGIPDDFVHESWFETGKNESFADDSTTCTRLEYGDLLALKTILSNFVKLAGLKCNFEKTSLMRIGNLEGEIDPRINTLGFQVVDECKLLGFTFSNKLDLATSNKKTVTDKITNTIRFWNTFGLSIAGKVTVAKSLILPLFYYYACVLNFDTETLKSLESKIEKFITSGINISKEKIYRASNPGG